MAWNTIKFHLLRIGNNENLKIETSILGPYNISAIEERDTVRYLGVSMDNKLNFNAQRNKVISKSDQKVRWVL